MPTAREQVEQQRADANSGRKQYWIDDAADIEEARDAVLATAEATWDIGGGTTLVLLPESCEAFEIGEEWFGVAHYGTEDDQQSTGGGETSFSFDTTGATEHIVASKATVGAFAAAGEAANVADNGNLIGVGDGENVEGVDIPVPKLGFTVTKSFPISQATGAYIKTLATVGVNADAATITTDDGVTIEGEAGELLYFGAVGGAKNGKLEVQFLLGFSPNIANRTIGDIAGITAKGWEYIWARRRHVVVNNRLTVKPIAAYVEQVFDPIDFAALGINS